MIRGKALQRDRVYISYLSIEEFLLFKNVLILGKEEVERLRFIYLATHSLGQVFSSQRPLHEDLHAHFKSFSALSDDGALLVSDTC